MKETINSRWSVRELQRQRNSLLYERLVLSSDKAKVLELSKEGQALRQGKDLLHLPTEQELIEAIEEEKKNLELNEIKIEEMDS